MAKSILVIDDDEAIRKSFVLALEDTIYEIDTAESGEKGILKFNEKNYDLIFLDLKMPDLNGVETLHELRKINEKVPIFIVTAFYKEYFDQLKAAVDKGIDFELLNKPIGNNDIISVVKSVFEGPIMF